MSFQTRTIWLMAALLVVALTAQFVIQVVVLGDTLARFLAATFQVWGGVALTWLGWSLVLVAWRPLAGRDEDRDLIDTLNRIERRLRNLERGR